MSDTSVVLVFARETNPSGVAARVAETLAGLLAVANRGARTRTLAAPTAERVAAIMGGQPDGGWMADGGGVANSYGFRTGTTRCGIAWFTAPAGETHVRVSADRATISGRHVTGVFGAKEQPEVSVYPDLRPPLVREVESLPKGWRIIARDARDNPADAVTRSALADRLDEYADELESAGRRFEAGEVRALAARERAAAARAVLISAVAAEQGA